LRERTRRKTNGLTEGERQGDLGLPSKADDQMKIDRFERIKGRGEGLLMQCNEVSELRGSAICAKGKMEVALKEEAGKFLPGGRTQAF